VRQTECHGGHGDDRAMADRCWAHDRHNDGRNPGSLPVAEPIPNSRHEAVWITARGSCREGKSLDADLSERLQL
jgi:hypothetical protein